MTKYDGNIYPELKQKDKVWVKCKWSKCGKDFQAEVRVIRKGGGEYCCLEHYWEDRRIEVKCVICGNTFTTIDYKPSDTCGRSCRKKKDTREAKERKRIVSEEPKPSKIEISYTDDDLEWNNPQFNPFQ